MNSDISYKKILMVSYPIVLSLISTTCLTFVDRLFFAHYNEFAFAAAIPAGMLSFLFICFFSGVIGYSATLIAYFRGKAEGSSILPILIAALLLSGIFFIFLLAISPLAKFIFAFFAHNPKVLAYELIYFKTLIGGSLFFLFVSAFSSYFIGINSAKTVLYLSLFMNIVNVALDYGLIFGSFGLPELGMFGGALSTVISNIVSSIIYFMIIRAQNKTLWFGALKNIKSIIHSSKKLLRFGVPRGAMYIIDLLGWLVFVLLMGEGSVANSVANNFVFSIERLAFMPLTGLAVAVSTLVGLALGRNSESEVRPFVTKSILILAVYCCFIFLLCTTGSGYLFQMFNITPSHSNLISLPLLISLFLPLFLVANGAALMMQAVLEGCGETKFRMFCNFVFTPLIFIPCQYYILGIRNKPAIYGWAFYIVYLFFIFAVLLFRLMQINKTRRYSITSVG